jgi:hypothetical protein
VLTQLGCARPTYRPISRFRSSSPLFKHRYPHVTPASLLRVDAAKVKAEENLDGKYLLRTSDPRLPAEDIALGYRQLLEVERSWRDLKQAII